MVRYKEICAASNFAGQVPNHLHGKKIVKIYPWHSEVLDLQTMPSKLPGSKTRKSKKS